MSESKVVPCNPTDEMLIADLRMIYQEQIDCHIAANMRCVEVEERLASIRAETYEACITAIDDAGGDNAQYHIEAIRKAAKGE